MNLHRTARLNPVVAILLALLLIATACGGGSEGESSSTAGAAGSTSSSSSSSSDGPPGDACNLLSDDFVAGLLNTEGETFSYFDDLSPTYTDHCEWLVKDFDGEFPGEIENIEIHIYDPGYFADDNAFNNAAVTPLAIADAAVASVFDGRLHRLQMTRNDVEVEVNLSFTGIVEELDVVAAQLELVAAEIDRNS